MAKCLLALPGTPLPTQLTAVSSEMVSGLCYTEFLLPPLVISQLCIITLLPHVPLNKAASNKYPGEGVALFIYLLLFLQ